MLKNGTFLFLSYYLIRWKYAPQHRFFTELEKCLVVYVFSNYIMRILWSRGVRVKRKQWVPRRIWRIAHNSPYSVLWQSTRFRRLYSLHSTALILPNAFSIMLFSYSSSRCLFNPIFDSRLQYGQYKQSLPIRD